MTDYKTAADTTFKTTMELWKDYTNFWQLWCIADSFTDYWLRQGTPIPDAETAPLVEKFLVRNSVPWDAKDVAKNPIWWDDYCWGAIAPQRASQHPKTFPNHAKLFGGMANQAWEPPYRNAPYTWARAANIDVFKPYEPAYDGGVWNYFFSEKEIPIIPHTPTTPGMQDALGGMQNTVTNALYWIMMARLYLAAPDAQKAGFLAQVKNEVSFMTKWFADGLMAQTKTGDVDEILIRERVGHYLNGDPVPDYKEDLFWAGDQGLILGALIAQIEIAGAGTAEAKQYQDWAIQLTNGVINRMKMPDGSLAPWIPYTADEPYHGAPGSDVDDYSTGIGVYMRYLLHAYQNNAAIKAHLDDPKSGYRDFVKLNADTALKNQNNAAHKGDKAILYFANDLAVFLMALEMGL